MRIEMNLKHFLIHLMKNLQIRTLISSTYITHSFSDELLANMINIFVKECETNNCYEWRYYYVKYDIFRPGSFGKYYWDDFEKRPYEFYVMTTEAKISEYSYQPFLKVVYTNKLSKDHLGQRAIDGENYVICQNSSYVIKNSDNDEVVKEIKIAQNENGIDIEDRIEKIGKTIID